jgi:hypothetical protein
VADSGQPQTRTGGLGRLWGALKRLLLNKSGEDYTVKLAGGERYWTEALRGNRVAPKPPDKASR